MRSTLRGVLNRIFLVQHPRPGTLIALKDGELRNGRKEAVTLHLARCAYCRNRLDDLQNGLQFFDHSLASSGPAFSVEEGLKRLSSAIQDGRMPVDNQPLLDTQTKPSSVLYSRLLSELSIYLGQDAARRLLARCNSLQHRERLLVVVKPVVTTFLGKNAGAAVLTNILRIWDSAHVAS